MIDPLPPLDRTAPTFKTDCDAYFATRIPAFGVQVEAARVEILAAAAAADTSADAAAASAVDAAADASQTAADAAQTALDRIATAADAATAASYSSALTGTSTTSLAIETGSKSFTATEGRQWSVGQFLVAASAANPANFMHGQVTSYNAGSGALVLNVLDIGGTGTKTDWNITLSAPKGEPGATGPSGKLIRVLVTGTTQAAADGYDYWLTNAAATVVTAPALVDQHRFKVTPRNGLKTNTIDFGTDTVRGPGGTATGVVTLGLGAPMEVEASTTLNEWGMS